MTIVLITGFLILSSVLSISVWIRFLMRNHLDLYGWVSAIFFGWISYVQVMIVIGLLT